MKKSCPLCNNEVFSGLGEGCKMCGMHLEDKNEEFCSKICRNKFNKIKEGAKIKRIVKNEKNNS